MGEARDLLNVVSSPRGAIRKRYGCVQLGQTTYKKFEPLAITDSFTRADENPLANAGKWSTLNGKARPKLKTKTVEPNGTSENYALYTPGAEQLNPLTAITPAGPWTTGSGSSISVLTNFNLAGTNGWQARLWRKEKIVRGEEEGYAIYAVELIRWVGGVPELKWKTTVKLLEAELLMAFGTVCTGGGSLGVWYQSETTAPSGELIFQRNAESGGGYSGIAIQAETGTRQLDNFTVEETEASGLTGLGSQPAHTISPVQIGAVPYLVVGMGEKLLSLTKAGVYASIKTGLKEKRWSLVQATAGAPNKKTADGPVYMVNGEDKPQYWTGATASTETKPWVVENAAGYFSETVGGEASLAPNGKYMVYVGNRIWMAGMANDTSAVRFTGFSVKAEEGEQCDPTAWPKENVVWFEKEDGAPITGIGTTANYVLVFKRHKVWAIYDLNEGENRIISDGIGCVAHRSIVETSQGTFFLTPDQGVFVTNGSTVREVSRNVRPILQGTHTNEELAAKLSNLEEASAGYLNGHYYLSYKAQNGSWKTLDYDTVLQSWWIHDAAARHWAQWEPEVGKAALYAGIFRTGASSVGVANVCKMFVPETYQDMHVNYIGAKGLSCFWASPWEPFWQYFQRHRFNQPNPKKRIRELFVDGKGELITLAARGFNGTPEELKGVVDNADMATPTSPVTLGNAEKEYQAVRYWSLGVSRVWSFLFGNNSAEPMEIDSFSVHLFFRKS